MTFDLILALAAFALSSSTTPGPNNMLLLASGANFGFARSIPHMCGIIFGFPAMIVLIGIGIMQIFDAFPWLYTVLKVAAVAYMLWLAWKIANAGPVAETGTKSRPMTFLEACAFQWVNPKGWTMGLGAITLYAVSQTLGSVLIVASAFLLSGIVSSVLWVQLGTAVQRVLSNETRRRAFNWTMAVALVASMVPVLL